MDATGLLDLDVLCRFPDLRSHEQTVHIMRYIFPRQFGHHNVFTSKTESRETVQPYKDYLLREEEIARAELRRRRSPKHLGKSEKQKTNVPKRLRGWPTELVLQIRKRHTECPYAYLLRHYCPVKVSSEVKCQPFSESRRLAAITTSADA